MDASPAAAAFDRAKARFFEGLQCQQAGRLVEAVEHYLASLADVPGRSSTLTNLAAARLQLGQYALALEDATAAEVADSSNLEAKRHRATALAELGRTDEALAAFRALARLVPEHPNVWMSIGNLLMEQKNMSEAGDAFQAALRWGADVELSSFYLAAARAATATTNEVALPPSPPRAYVETLFDRYAGDFDAHLVEQLGYEAPQRLVEGLRGLGATPRAPGHAPGHAPGRVLDLGCGTGLCARWLRPLASRLVGVDLSAAMLERARTLGLYDQLDHADITVWLETCRERFDLVVAADVFIYVGALDTVFEGVARLLDAGGSFAFTLETPSSEGTGGTGFVLRPTLRYAHTVAYVTELAQRYGLRVVAAHPGTVRHDADGPITGCFVYVQAPG